MSSNDKENSSEKKIDQKSDNKSALEQKDPPCPVLKITGFSPIVDRPKIYTFLQSFGKVIDIQYNQNSVTFQYKDGASLQRLLRNPLRFNNDYLQVTITHGNIKELKKRKDINEIAPEHEELINKLRTVTEADEQLVVFMKELQLPEEEIRQHYCLLCTHLEFALRPVFKDCIAMPFGSTATGLAFKGSDLDVFMHVPYPPKSIDNSSSLPAFYVNEARKPLFRKSHLFTKILTISKAKTPIVKCVHKPTGIHCDINFKNRLGVCNTGLIKFLLGKDIRLLPIMMIIKYWAKLNEIVGNGKFTNYSLVMLLIYYLQQEFVGILPCIVNLQTPEYDDIIEGWNAGYNSNFNFPISNNDMIPKLLHGFFKYYSTYEFGMKVISPFIGQEITKTNFVDFKQLPDVFWRYKEMLQKNQITPLITDTSICVQDPFEHNHNLTRAVSVSLVKHFQNCCMFAAEICEDILKTRKLTDLLPRLFTERYVQGTNTLGNQVQNEIVILAGNIVGPKNTSPSNSINSEEYLRKYWYEKVNELLLITLKKVFKFELNLSKDEPQSKTPRLDNSSDVHEHVVESFIIHCTSYYIFHHGRKKISKQIKKTSSSLNYEIEISDYMMKNKINKKQKAETEKQPVLEIDIVFTACKNPTRVLLDIKNRNPKLSHLFMTFTEYFERFPTWIAKFLQETN